MHSSWIKKKISKERVPIVFSIHVAGGLSLQYTKMCYIQPQTIYKNYTHAYILLATGLFGLKRNFLDAFELPSFKKITEQDICEKNQKPINKIWSKMPNTRKWNFCCCHCTT